MVLTVKAIENLQPKIKDYKVSDEGWLYLLVKPSGAKYWRMSYRYAGKQKTLSLGVYDKVSLKAARLERDNAKALLFKGIDPSTAKKQIKLSIIDASESTFGAISREWLDKSKGEWSLSHQKKQLYLVEKNLLPYLDLLPIKEITPLILLNTVRKTEQRGALETARRVMQISSQIFRYAVAIGKIERDPSTDLRGALQSPKTEHYSSVTEPAKVGKLLRALDAYEGTPQIQTALKIAPYIFVRPGELRHMLWSEINFIKAIWIIPESKTKSKKAHIVPLCKQALNLLIDLRKLSGNSEFVFPSQITNKRPISDNSLNVALRRMGIPKEEMTAHGFRAMARTLLDEELNFAPHLIEHQLAHNVQDPLGRAYNRTQHLEKREEMMQVWGDYLDSLRQESNLFKIHNHA